MCIRDRRYASIDAPYHLYVTGEGSEFGTDPAAAKQMRELGDGKFEIYTRFTGSFSFINRNAAGSKRTFGVAEGRLTEGADAAGTGLSLIHIWSSSASPAARSFTVVTPVRRPALILSTRRSTASPMPRASTSGLTEPSTGRSCRAGAWIPRLWLRRPAGWN